MYWRSWRTLVVAVLGGTGVAVLIAAPGAALPLAAAGPYASHSLQPHEAPPAGPRAQASNVCASGWTSVGGGYCDLTVKYTGSAQTVTVPSGINQVEIGAYGAAGYSLSSGYDAVPPDGSGGFAAGYLNLNPATTTKLTVAAGGEGQNATTGAGGQGGYGGGGSGGLGGVGGAGVNGTNLYGGSGGGGGTFIWASGGALLLAAGGGGGQDGSGHDGGDGGGSHGTFGDGASGVTSATEPANGCQPLQSGCDPDAADGATSSAGGAGGQASSSGTNGMGPAAGSGSFGAGGTGGGWTGDGGGGGGGGYYGGGGGGGGNYYGGGGGGGSDYVSSTLTNTSQSIGGGAQAENEQPNGSLGNGYAILEYLQPTTVITGTIVTPFNDGWKNAAVDLTGTETAGGAHVSMTTTTDASGDYSFALEPGTYTVTPQVPAADLPAGSYLYTPTQCAGTVSGQTCANIALAANQDQTANFTASYTLTGTVQTFDQSTGQQAAAGAKVLIQDTEQGTLQKETVTTNANGQIVASAGASSQGVELAPGSLVVSAEAADGTVLYPVPGTGSDPDCVTSGTNCDVNFDHDRSVQFTGCVIPNPNGAALPPPLDTDSSMPIPGAVTAGNLEAVGCWTPESGTPATANIFDSAHPIRLDGLDLAPAPGTTFVLDKGARSVKIDGDATLMIGGFTIWPYLNGETLNFASSSIGVSDIGLGEAYGGFSGPRIAGVPLAIGTGGSFPTLVPPWLFSPGQTSLSLNPVVPVRANAASWDWTKGEFALGGETVPNVGPQVILRTTNREGLLLSNTDLCLTFGDQDLNSWETGQAVLPPEDRLVLNGITGCYNLHTNASSLTGQLELGKGLGGPGVGPDRFNFSAGLQGFHLTSLGAQFDGLNKAVGYGIYFQRMGLNATWTPTSGSWIPSAIELNGGISFGPQLNEGNAKPLIEEYPFLEGLELASANVSGAVVLGPPLQLQFKGSILMFRRTPLQLTLGGGFVNWWPTTGQFTFGGELTGWPIVPAVKLSANWSGWLDADPGALSSGAAWNPTFQLQGHGDVIPLVGKGISVDALMNNHLVVACTSAFGGWVYNWTTNQQMVFPPGACNLGSYAVPAPGFASSPDRADAAAARSAGSVSVRIGHKLSFTVLAVHGSSAPPVVTLSGPGGVRITTPASGSLHTGDAMAVVDPADKTTYIALAHPHTGVWKLTRRPGSPPLASVREADPSPAPKLSARVGLAGCSEQVTYSYRPVAGVRTSLYAANGAERTYLGLARPGTHRLSFAPALTGKGLIEALVTRGLYPEPTQTLATYNPSAYKRSATPRHITVKKGTLRWSGGCGDSSYEVVIASGPATITKSTRAAHLKLPAIHGRYTVTVEGFTAGGEMTSATAKLGNA